MLGKYFNRGLIFLRQEPTRGNHYPLFEHRILTEGEGSVQLTSSFRFCERRKMCFSFQNQLIWSSLYKEVNRTDLFPLTRIDSLLWVCSNSRQGLNCLTVSNPPANCKRGVNYGAKSFMTVKPVFNVIFFLFASDGDAKKSLSVCPSQVFSEAIILVMHDPSMNELWVT